MKFNHSLTIIEEEPHNIEVLEFNEKNLIKSFIDDNDLCVLSEQNIKDDKKHYLYFLEYFKDIGTKSIVIEKEYTDKDFLSDFSTYYSYCFERYKRRCKRVHFFSCELDGSFKQLILQDEVKLKEVVGNKWEEYIGFIIVKPLPKTIIGRTILKTYPFKCENGNVRTFPTTRKYQINFYGNKIYLDSLAFQEQDKVLSACATSALWTAFHKTSSLFQTPLPTPNELTKAAGNLFHKSGRSFPTHGLEAEEVCRAIEFVGLECELRNKGPIKISKEWFKAFVYAYTKMGLPVLVGIKIKGIGNHLITFVGSQNVRYDKINRKKRINKDGPILYSTSIDQFYAHDDQIGPFCRIKFSGRNKNFQLITAWWKETNINDKRLAHVECVIVPLYHKIRLTFKQIYTRVAVLEGILKSTNLFGGFTFWDVFLQIGTEYKFLLSQPNIINDLYLNSDDTLITENRKKILFNNMPRFFWVARLITEGVPIIEFIFDATEIDDSPLIFDILYFDNEVKKNIQHLLKNKEFLRKTIIKKLNKKYLTLLEK